MNKKIKKYVMTLDLGKDSVKVIGFDCKDNALKPKTIKKVIFKTKSYNLKKYNMRIHGNSHKVIFNGKEMIVGEQGTDRDYDTSKTTSLHQLCAYTAITQYLEPGSKDNEVYIVLACPVNVLRSPVDKESYRNLIKGDGPISINVDSKDYTFEIKDITIKAEGSGILYLARELFKDKKVAVVDFGGLNMTVTIFKNGICVNPERNRFAIKFGSIELINRLVEFLTSYRNGDIVNYETAEEALERGYLLYYGKRDETSIAVIEDTKTKFFKDTFQVLAKNSIKPIDLDNVVFIGGTSNYLKAQIREVENGLISDDPQWSSVQGLFKIALKKYAK